MNPDHSKRGSALDLFCGAGGASLGLHAAGLDVLGIEWDVNACATHEAAGFDTLRADIAALDPSDFAGRDFLWASPPCQAYSMAGKRAGERDKNHVIACSHELAAGNDTRAEHKAKCEDERSLLVVEALRWTLALRPTFVCFEQVPPVLELWTLYAHLLERVGYKTWAGVLSSETFGVPQTRRRAFLIASLAGPVAPPEPTHQSYTPGEPAQEQHGLFGTLKPWVSMAEALGWSGTLRTGDNTMKHSRDPQDMVPYERDVDCPAPVVDTKGTWKHGEEHVDPPMRWKNVNVPAPTVTGGGSETGGPEPFGRGGRQRLQRAIDAAGEKA